MNKDVLSRDPWPAQGIEQYRRIADGEWGYLICHCDGSFCFDTKETPGREEIMGRWAYYLTEEEQEQHAAA